MALRLHVGQTLMPAVRSVLLLLRVTLCPQLADEQWGVIGIKWKETSCDK